MSRSEKRRKKLEKINLTNHCLLMTKRNMKKISGRDSGVWGEGGREGTEGEWVKEEREENWGGDIELNRSESRNKSVFAIFVSFLI